MKSLEKERAQKLGAYDSDWQSVMTGSIKFAVLGLILGYVSVLALASM